MRNSQKVVSLIFIGAIAVVFVLQFGPASSGFNRMDATNSAAAMVNGREIPIGDFNRALSNQVEMYRSQGMALTEQQLKQFGIPQRLLEQMISGELLAQAAERRGIQASDEEIRDVLHKNELFKNDQGAFDFETYRRNVSAYYQRTPIAYENDLRRDLAGQKLLKIISESANVSEEEVKARFFREGNKAQLTFVRFDPSSFAAQVKAPTDAEVKAWAESHQKEIGDYYAANAYLYKKPEQVRARHILIKSDKSDPQDRRDAARKKAEEVRAKVEGGTDFAQAAREFSEDEGSKVQGGDLGFNERANWVKPFADAAFALEPGKISDIVESEFGFHIIKVDEKKPASERSQKDAETEIARQLLTREKAKALAKAEADKALAAAQKGKKLTELYPEQKPTPGQPASEKPAAVSTGSFVAEGDNIPQLGPAPDLSRDVFGAQGPALLPKVYEAGESFVVAEVTERKRPSEEDFTAQKDSLRNDARRAKEFELRDSFIKTLKQGAQVKTNPEIASGGAS